jgi:lambda repressor-like predicted transcriptional regulator
MPRPPSPVKAILAARGITMTEVADRLGISRAVLYGAINRGPTWPKLRRDLAALLAVDEGEIFPGEPAKPLAELADTA